MVNNYKVAVLSTQIVLVAAFIAFVGYIGWNMRTKTVESCSAESRIYESEYLDF